jgi:hypothetical protein
VAAVADQRFDVVSVLIIRTPGLRDIPSDTKTTIDQQPILSRT